MPPIPSGLKIDEAFRRRHEHWSDDVARLAADEALLLDEARKVASSIPPKLLEVLDEEIRKADLEEE